jgi:hypothetical protein
MYCRHCQKEVVVVGVSHGAATADDVESMRRGIEKDGKIALFNPPPMGPHFCPDCGTELHRYREAAE